MWWSHHFIGAISPTFAKVWMTSMFGYGFLRSYRADYPSPLDYVPFRLGWSTCRGFMYASPLGVYYLGETLGRFGFKRESSQLYPFLYTDGLTVNRRIFI